MQADTIREHVHAGIGGRVRPDTMMAAAMAALLGALLVWGVGLSPIAALHNAAHDTRHSMVFPCH